MNVTKQIILTSVFLVSSFVQLVNSQRCSFPLPRPPITNPDIGKSTPQEIVAHGYPCENHTITTEDGYILKFFRIPFGKTPASAARTGKPVVLLVHGLLSSSIQWFLQTEPKTLAYQLVEQGYDVWLANSRGTSYSMGHTNLSCFESAYWKFSWEQMGYYDLPAAIDYILDRTGLPQLFYVGHSQGTTQFFVMATLRPEYNDKIQLMIAYAPVAFMYRVRGPIRLIAPGVAAVSLVDAGDFTGIPVLPQCLLDLLHIYAPAACTPELVALYLCENSLFLISGFDSAQTNVSDMPRLLSDFPDSASLSQIFHYEQEMQSGHFAQFDFGIIKNIFKYGTITPTDFNISAISAPIALFWADNDWLSHPLDVAKFRLKLPPSSLALDYKVPLACFNHLDYITAINASELVYEKTIETMNAFL